MPPETPCKKLVLGTYIVLLVIYIYIYICIYMCVRVYIYIYLYIISVKISSIIIIIKIALFYFYIYQFSSFTFINFLLLHLLIIVSYCFQVHWNVLIYPHLMPFTEGRVWCWVRGRCVPSIQPGATCYSRYDMMISEYGIWGCTRVSGVIPCSDLIV